MGSFQCSCLYKQETGAALPIFIFKFKMGTDLGGGAVAVFVVVVLDAFTGGELLRL